MIKKLILLLFFHLFILMNIFSQNEKEKLAAQFFNRQEYSQAAVLYEELIKQDNNSYYYNNYLECLIKLEQFDIAEKVIKKQIKLNELTPKYKVDLGYIYKLDGKIDKSEKTYQETIKSILNSETFYIDLANAFLLRQENLKAIETYQKAKKELSNSTEIYFELAKIYSSNKNFKMMINELIDLLIIDEYLLEKVQDYLQDILAKNQDQSQVSDIIEQELIKLTQKNADKTFINELLMWFYIQSNNFESAYIQAQALDKRLKTEGLFTYNLGTLASDNNNFDIAEKAFNYLIDKKGSYYVKCKIALVDVLNKRITNGKYTQNDLLKLEEVYKNNLEELGYNYSTISLQKGYSHLLAFYLNKTEEAINILYDCLEIRGIPKNKLADIKIELADVLLLNGEIWDAKLFYGQVEKEFKEDVIGQFAKYKNAKLSYYAGDFEWAKAQLDVLRASTTKLIANDAMQLSLTISDNMALDTTIIPLYLYAKSDLLIYQNKFDDAIKTLDTIKAFFPFHSTLGDDILYTKSNIYLKTFQYQKAISCLDSIVEFFSMDIYADDALYKMGEIYQFNLNDNTKAFEYYKKLITQYPGSLYTTEARKRYRQLRGDKISN